MKILIVGASGTIGSAVADRLAGQHTVVRASRLGNVRVDVRDTSSLEAVSPGFVKETMEERI